MLNNFSELLRRYRQKKINQIFILKCYYFIKDNISFVYLLFFYFTGCWGLKGMNLIVPTAVRVGDSLNISCEYDLERELLYSVKFYRGDQEFYRFIPKESPPTKVFPLEGINVDVSTAIII